MGPGAHAPTGIHGPMRTVPRRSASRSGSHKARRIEHRVSGGDVNPYLMLAGRAGGRYERIEGRGRTPLPDTCNALPPNCRQISGDWEIPRSCLRELGRGESIFAPRNGAEFSILDQDAQELHYRQELTPQEQVESIWTRL